MTTKYTRFRDIPPFTRDSSYTVNVGWDYLEKQLESYERPGTPLVLDPDFQRAHVWDEIKQRRYVEYVLRGGRSSRIIYWNCASWQREYNTPIFLVDGKQRLEAVRKFMRSELLVFGSYRNEFTDKIRGVMVDFVFSINTLQTRAEMLQWYIDLNAGGVAHTDDEIEKVRELLKEECHASTH